MRFFAIFLLLAGLSAGCNSKTAEIEAKEAANKEALAKQAAAKAAEAAAPACTYTLTEATPSWTAYKTSDKAGVSGTFNTVKLSETKPGDTLTAALAGLSAEIEGASVESGNPARNTTLAQAFFSKFAAETRFGAKITGASGDEKEGLIMVMLEMNGVSKPIQLKHDGLQEGTLTAKAVIDMLDYALQAPFDSLHSACEGLHTGKDGVAKTWTEVEVSLTAKIDKKCQ